uniref:Uncharacterized protein n=1 Tax=Plectus sambesii TaxID=2011161 RepID=A0A914XLA4_9BILA
MGSLLCTSIALLISFIVGILALLLHLSASVAISFAYWYSINESQSIGAIDSRLLVEATTTCFLSALSFVFGVLAVCSLWWSRLGVNKLLLLLSSVAFVCFVLNSTPLAVWMRWVPIKHRADKCHVHHHIGYFAAGIIGHFAALVIELLVGVVAYLVKRHHSRRANVSLYSRPQIAQLRKKRAKRHKKTLSMTISAPTAPLTQRSMITDNGIVAIPLPTTYESVDHETGKGRNFGRFGRNSQPATPVSETESSSTTPIWRDRDNSISTTTSDLSVHRRSTASFVPLQPGTLASRCEEQKTHC